MIDLGLIRNSLKDAQKHMGTVRALVIRDIGGGKWAPSWVGMSYDLPDGGPIGEFLGFPVYGDEKAFDAMMAMMITQKQAEA